MTKKAVGELHPTYRADIDGLRTVAVLSVIGFHAFPRWVRGGFIGVDIFFVISGYLISTIIFSNLEHRSFSIIDFYNRRIRRIFPALITVIAASWIFGWHFLLADEYAQLGKHIVAGAAFVSNFALYGESGYFDTGAGTKPLLHLWSLAIEEQFYIFWPLMLAFVWKRKWSFLHITAVIAVLSFATNIYLVHINPTAAFYFPISRFWELMIGGVLAYLALHKPEITRNYQNIQSTIGFALIATGLIFISNDAPFPSWRALLPTVGTFLVISAGQDAWLNKKILTRKMVVWIGLISYPLYLWHWPILAFAQIIEGQIPSLQFRVFAIVVTFILASLTYLFIENPIRHGKIQPSKSIILLSVMVTIGCMGSYTYGNKGLPFRANAMPMAQLSGDIGQSEFFSYIKDRFSLCTPSSIAENAPKYDKYVRCAQSQQNANVEVAIVGDSHAEHLFIGLADALPGTNVAYYIKDGPPYLNRSEFTSVYKTIIESRTIKKVVISLYWAGLLKKVTTPSVENGLSMAVGALLASGKDVYIANDVPFSPLIQQNVKYNGRE